MILLHFVWATPLGGWNLHLAASAHMLRWIFAYDRTRESFLYFADMWNISTTHPVGYRTTSSREYVVEQTEGSLFSQSAMNQTLEKFWTGSSNLNALWWDSRWILVVYTGVSAVFADWPAIQACYGAMTGRFDRFRSRNELGKNRILKDETMFETLWTLFSQWRMLFSYIV